MRRILRGDGMSVIIYMKENFINPNNFPVYSRHAFSFQIIVMNWTRADESIHWWDLINLYFFLITWSKPVRIHGESRNHHIWPVQLPIFFCFLWWTYLGEVQQGVCFYSRLFLPAIFYCPVFQNKRPSQMKKCHPVDGNNDLLKWIIRASLYRKTTQ